MNIDLRSWSKRDLWPLPSGELAVRPGLRKVHDTESGREIVGGWTVKNPYNGDVWHYICDVSTSGDFDFTVRIYDETFTAVQAYTTEADAKPKVVTYAVVQDQIMIAAPEIPTLWGWVGNAITTATSKASDNPSTTAIDVPKGICVAWANRCVIASGPALFVSDPVAATGGSPRTFVAQNQQNRPGAVYGLHVTEAGDLVACTTAGVYGLPVDAAAAGQVALGTWDKLDDYRTADYGQTCVSRGAVWGLTQRGVRQVDGRGRDEMMLDEPRIPTRDRARIAASDYRAHARITGGDDGPIVSLEPENAAHFVDLATGVRSWWTKNDFKVRGILHTFDGEPIVLTDDAAYRVGGNFDGNLLLSDGETEFVYGFLVGRTPTPPEASPVVRAVDSSTDSQGISYVTLMGEFNTENPPAYAGTSVIGTDVWGSGSTMSTPPLRSRRHDFAIRTDEIAMEVGCEDPLSRIQPSVDVTLKGPGKRRRSN